jgi:hypothetical protein
LAYSEQLPEIRDAGFAVRRTRLASHRDAGFLELGGCFSSCRFGAVGLFHVLVGWIATSKLIKRFRIGLTTPFGRLRTLQPSEWRAELRIVRQPSIFRIEKVGQEWWIDEITVSIDLVCIRLLTDIHTLCFVIGLFSRINLLASKRGKTP